MSNSILPPPPYQSAVIRDDKRIDLSWADWIKELYVRVGKAVAPTNDTIGGGNVSGYVGAAGIPETTFTFVNNQSTPADITGLAFSTSVQTAEVEIQFYRLTTGVGAVELCARAKYLVSQKPNASTWTITSMGFGGDVDPNDTNGNPAGVGISITSLGQAQYVSTNLTGTPSKSAMHFIAKTMST